MANIGSATLTIVPKFENTSAAVHSAFGGIDVSNEGERLGQSYTKGVSTGAKGLAASGALVGAFSAITNKAMSAVANSVGAAANRLDTLNNYPRVMQALGYSAADAQASISQMDQHLRGLPTSVNQMAYTVQGFTAVIGDLDKATNVGLALNDMFLASGASTQVANAAMEQFRQVLAKGKPDMQDWKSIVSAAPGQMDQLAKAMLGPTANANQLYAALGGGKNKATISIDDLLNKIVELDTQGGAGITSFADQAKNATGGVQTSVQNMQTAVTRGVADVMKAFGTDNIKSITSDIGTGFENALKGVASAIESVKPALSSLLSSWEVTIGRMMTGAKSIADFFTTGSQYTQNFINSFGGFTSINASIMGVVTTIGLLHGALAAVNKIEAFKGANSKITSLQREATQAQTTANTETTAAAQTAAANETSAAAVKASATEIAAAHKSTAKAATEAATAETLTSSAKSEAGSASTALATAEGTAAAAHGKTASAATKATKATEELGEGAESAASKTAAVGEKAVEAGSKAGSSASKISKFASSLTQSATAGGWVGAAIDAAIIVGGSLIGMLADQAAKEQELKNATEGLQQSFSNLGDTATATAALHAQSQAELRAQINQTGDAISKNVQSQAQLADSIEQNNQTAANSIATLEYYTKIIDGLGSNGVPANRIGALTNAVNEFNKACGTNYTVDQETGQIKDQSGAVVENTMAFDRLAESKKKAYEQKALQDDFTDLMKQHTQNLEQGKAAYNEYKEALLHGDSETAQSALNNFHTQEEADNSLITVMKNTQAANDILTESQKQGASTVALSIAANVDSMVSSFDASGQSMQQFKDQLDTLGLSDEQLQNLTDQDWNQMAANYDGTTGSIVASLQGFGVQLDDTQQKTADAAQAVDEARNSFSDLFTSPDWDVFAGHLQQLGVSTQDFADQAAQSGLSVQELSDIGGESFDSLYTACHGDMGKIKGELDAINTLHLDPKEITINDDGTIELADGRLIDLNNQTINDKHYEVNDDGSITVEGQKIASLNTTFIDDKEFQVDDNGTIETVDGHITGLNAENIADKGFTVTDDGTIQDKYGQIINLNDMTIDGKSFTVSDDGTIIVEGQSVGQLDGMQINPKDFSVAANIDPAEVAMNNVDNRTLQDHYTQLYGDDSAAWGAMNNVDNRRLSDHTTDIYGDDAPVSATFSDVESWHGSNVVSIIADTSGFWNAWNIITSATATVVANITGGHAAGGIRRHADGGIRYHANGGAIATRAMPLDVVGEDGAEAIVPLTNKQYSKPFAQTIAEQMGNVMGTSIVLNISDNHVNDNSAIQSATENYLLDLVRLGAINNA